MLHWALTFLVVPLVSGGLGFGGVAAVSVDIAQTLFFVFIILFAITAVLHVLTGRTPPSPPV